MNAVAVLPLASPLLGVGVAGPSDIGPVVAGVTVGVGLAVGVAIRLRQDRRAADDDHGE